MDRVENDRCEWSPEPSKGAILTNDPTTYDIALIVSIPADSYADALKQAENLADGIGDSEQLSISAVTDYESDNDGQRVVYLEGIER